MQTERWIEVRGIEHATESRDYGYWVEYVLLVRKRLRNGDHTTFLEHSGSRLIKAVDELDLYRKFPVGMRERHGVEPNNVRWRMNG
jgi:hypothetical protein